MKLRLPFLLMVAVLAVYSEHRLQAADIRISETTVFSNDSPLFGGDYISEEGGFVSKDGGSSIILDADTGGSLDAFGGGWAFGAGTTTVTGGAYIELNSGGNVNAIYGGGLVSGVPNGAVSTVVGGSVLNIKGGIVNYVFGGGVLSAEPQSNPLNAYEMMVSVDSAMVNISGGEVKGSVYGGGYAASSSESRFVTVGNAEINISGGSIAGNVFAGGFNGAMVTGRSTVTVTGGLLSASAVLDGSNAGFSVLNWGTSDAAYSGTVGAVQGWSDLNVAKGSSLTIVSDSASSAFTTTLDGTLTIRGGAFSTNDAYVHEGSLWNVTDGADVRVASYMAFGGRMTVENAKLTLGSGAAASADSIIGGNWSDTVLTIGKDGEFVALKGLAIGQRSDATMSKNGTVVVNQGGSLAVEGQALRVGAGRTTSDGTSGRGLLQIDGGTVATEMLFVGNVRDQNIAGDNKTYQGSGVTGAVTVLNGGYLGVETGVEGNCTILGQGAVLSVADSTLSTSGKTGPYKWFIAQDGAELSLRGSRATWNHAYQASLQEGSVFRLQDGATAYVDYLAYGSYDGLIQGGDGVYSRLILGANVGMRSDMDSVIGGTSRGNEVTTLTIGSNGMLYARKGLAIGHRSDATVSKDAVLKVLTDGLLEVRGEALRVGAGRSLNSDGTSGKGALLVSGGEVMADDIIVGDVDSKIMEGKVAGQGMVLLEKKGSIVSVDSLTLGASGTLAMDSLSSLYVNDVLILKGGTATIGGINSIGRLDIQSGALNLSVSGRSMLNGSVLNLVEAPATMTGTNVVFSTVDKGLDYIGKTIGLVCVGDALLDIGDVMIEGTLVSKGATGKLDRDGVAFDWTYDSGSIKIADTVVTVLPSGSNVSSGTTLEMTTSLGRVMVDSDKLWFQANPSAVLDGASSEWVNVGENLKPISGIDMATQQLAEVVVVTETLSDGTIRRTEKQTPVGHCDVSAIINESAILSADDASKKGIFSVDNAAVVSSGSLLISNTDMTVGKRLTMSEGAELTIGEGGSLTIGGGSTDGLSDDVARESLTSRITGAKVMISQGGSLNAGNASGQGTMIVTGTEITMNPDALSSLDQVATLSGKGTDLLLVSSKVSGTGIVSNLRSSDTAYTAGHSPGMMTLENVSSQGDSFTVYIVSDRVQSGAMNDDATIGTGVISQFVIKGHVQMDNATFKVSLNGSDASTLTEDTAFRFFDLSSGTLDGNFVSYDLPDLDGDLFWNMTSLMKNGVASILTARMGEGGRIANTMWSAAQSVTNFAKTALGHVNDYRTGLTNVWMGGLGDFSHTGNHNGRTGYDYQSGGYAVGIDRMVTKNTIVGIALGQTYGKNTPTAASLRYSAGNIDQDGIMGTLYKRAILMKPTEKDTISMESYLSYGVVSNDSSKSALYDASLPVATGSWDEEVWSLGVAAVLNHQVSERTNLACFVRVDYEHVSMDDFTEGNGSSWARYSGGNYQAWQLKIGATIDHTWSFANGMALKPSVTLAYVGDAMRNTPTVNSLDRSGKSLRESGVNPGRNAIQAGATLGWKISDSWGASAGYNVEARSGSVSQSVNLGTNYSF